MKSIDELIAERLHELPDRYPVAPAAAAPAPVIIRATARAAQWSAGIYRAYSYLSARFKEPWQLAELDKKFQQTVEDGPDFLKVRREAEFIAVPVVAYSPAAAAEIMKQAREIERETYACREKGKHGGGIGRTGMLLLEWFCFVMWPMAKNGMYPSLAYIAKGARMSKETVTEAMKTLELFGFLTVMRRRKRVQTPFGIKQVQDTNAYVLNLAKGLGALALAVFSRNPQTVAAKQGRPSESSNPSAKENHSYPLKAQGRIFGNIGNLGQRKTVFGNS
jgi:hypothetical protein